MQQFLLNTGKYVCVLYLFEMCRISDIHNETTLPISYFPFALELHLLKQDFINLSRTVFLSMHF